MPTTKFGTRRTLLSPRPAFTPKNLSGLIEWQRASLNAYADGAVHFTAASTQLLSVASTAALQGGNVDWWTSCWVNFDSLGTNRTVVGKRDTNQYEWLLFFNNGTSKLRFTAYDITAAHSAAADWTGTINTGTWYHVFCWFDSVGQTINISVNNGTPVSVSTATFTLSAGTGAFRVGAIESNGLLMDGAVDSLAWGKSPPGGIAAIASSMRSTLYNSGAGLVYSTASGNNTTWGTVAWWDMDESSGGRVDRIGSISLSPTNSPTLVAGKPAGPISGDNSVVSKLLDQSPNSNDQTQSTIASRPVSRWNVKNGLNVLRGDGAATWASSGLTLSQTFTTTAVFRKRSTSDNATLIDSAGTSHCAIETASGFFALYAGTSSISTGVATDTNWHILTVVWNGASTTFQFDGGAVTTVSGTPGTNGLTGLRVLSRYGGTQWGDYDLAELIVYNRGLNTVEQQQLFNYLNTVYSVTGSLIYLADAFAGTNGTDLASHTPNIGPPWASGTGGITLQSGQAQGGSDYSAYLTDPGAADCTITYTGTISGTSGSSRLVGLYFRYTDSTHCWLLQMSISGSNNLIALYKANGGSLTSQASNLLQVADTNPHSYKIICSGSNIDVYFDGVMLYRVTDSFNATVSTLGPRLSTGDKMSNLQALPNAAWTQPVPAIGSWTEVAGNPFYNPSPIRWDQQYSYTECFARNTDGTLWQDGGGNYFLYYAGSNTGAGHNDQVGLFTSTDLTTWTRYGTDPVLAVAGSPGYDSAEVQMGSVINVSGTLYGFYDAVSNNDINTFCIATSTDGKTWTKSGSNPIVSPSGSGQDQGGMFQPVVLYDGTWRCLYTGQDGGNTSHLVMYMTASSPTGPWTKYSTSAVFNPGCDVFIGDFFKIGSTYYITYAEYTGPFHTNPGVIMLATSPDCITWTVQGPLMVPTGSGWESVLVENALIQKISSTWHMAYTGSSNDLGNTQVYLMGLATAPG